MSILLALVLATLPAAPAASVGRLHFPVSCNAAAQRAFTRGLGALHSFWYEQARTDFQTAEKSDPRCAMAYWGEAMTHIQMLWMNDDTAAARAALARIPAPPKTARERAWLAAIEPLVSTRDPWPRRAGFAQAMEQVEHDYPDDESKSFLALALITAKPEFELARYVRAGALAMEVTAHNPDHPGALHYTIHAFDTPELAPLALPAARRYAEVAPAAPHARHMPAHIFARLGMWPEALASCESAWQASDAWVKREKRSPDQRDFHSFGWIIAIHATMGQPRAALASLAELARAADSPRLRSAYLARVGTVLEASGDWSSLDSLVAKVSAPANEPPVLVAGPACHGPARPTVDRYAVDLLALQREAAAARHDVAATDRLTAELVQARKQIAKHEEALAGVAVFARAQQIRALEDQALHAEAARDDLTAAARWQKAAEIEDAEPPAEGADGLGGDHALAARAFLRAHKSDDAAREFERSRARYPGWPESWAALGELATQKGDREAARRDLERAVELWSKAEPEFAPAKRVRAELAALPKP